MEPNLSQFHLARQMADTVREPFLVLDETLRVLYASGPFYRRFEVSPDETLGRPLFELGNGQWDIPRLRELLGDLLRAEPDGGAAVEDFPVEHEFESIGRRAMRLNARKLAGSPGERGSGLILLAIEDVTGQSRTAQALADSELRFRRLFEAAMDGILILDADSGAIIDANPYLLNLLGYTHADLLGKKLWDIGLLGDVEASKIAFAELQQKGYVRYEDLPLETKAHRHVEVEFVSNVYSVGFGRAGLAGTGALSASETVACVVLTRFWEA